MGKKLFQSVQIGEYFGLSAYDEANWVRIKQQSAPGPVPYFNARHSENGDMLYVPTRRYVYSNQRKGKRK